KGCDLPRNDGLLETRAGMLRSQAFAQARTIDFEARCTRRRAGQADWDEVDSPEASLSSPKPMVSRSNSGNELTPSFLIRLARRSSTALGVTSKRVAISLFGRPSRIMPRTSRSLAVRVANRARNLSIAA